MPTDKTLVPMRFGSTQLLWTVEGIYTPDECARIIEQIEAGAPSLATNNPLYRNQDRIMRDDPDASAELFERLRPHLPESIGELCLAGLNERLRYYRYREGQHFEAHMDHWYQPSPTRITLLTVLVYFNGDFEGGETRFMEQLEACVVPRPGLVAVFQHKVRHEGCAVTRGTKYAMRTEVLYDAPRPVELSFD